MSVRHTLLGLLAQKPRYGYELRAAFTALAGGSENWDVSPAQIYTTLKRLQESTLIQARDGTQGEPSDRQFFNITPAGEGEFLGWLHDPARSDHQQDSFYLKFALSMGMPQVDTQRLIQNQRVVLFQELHRVTNARQNLDARKNLATILLMDKVAMHLEADLCWLDMIEGRLEEVMHQPLPQPDLRPRGRPAKIQMENNLDQPGN